MSKIYCGIGKMPKNYKIGNMKECAETGQVRLYGLKKIDPRILEAAKKNRKGRESRDSIILKIATLRGKIRGMNKKIDFEKNKKTKQTLNNDLQKLKEDLSVETKKLKKIEGTNARTNFIRTSRRNSSKRTSNRRTSRRNSSRNSSKRTSRRNSSRRISRRNSSRRSSKRNSSRRSSKRNSSRRSSRRKSNRRKSSRNNSRNSRRNSRRN